MDSDRRWCTDGAAASLVNVDGGEGYWAGEGGRGARCYDPIARGEKQTPPHPPTHPIKEHDRVTGLSILN